MIKGNEKSVIYILCLSMVYLSGCGSSDSSTYTYNDLTFTGSLTGISGSGVGDETNYIVLVQKPDIKPSLHGAGGICGSFKFNSQGAIDQAIQSVDHNRHGDHFHGCPTKKDPFEMKAVAYLPGSSSEGYTGLKISENLSSPLTPFCG